MVLKFYLGDRIIKLDNSLFKQIMLSYSHSHEYKLIYSILIALNNKEFDSQEISTLADVPKYKCEKILKELQEKKILILEEFPEVN